MNLNLNPARNTNESFAAYRLRRKKNAQALKRYLAGRVIFCWDKVNKTGTYSRALHGEIGTPTDNNR